MYTEIQFNPETRNFTITINGVVLETEAPTYYDADIVIADYLRNHKPSRRCVTSGKKKYRRSAAKYVARRWKRRAQRWNAPPLYVYRCPDCGRYHLTRAIVGNFDYDMLEL